MRYGIISDIHGCHERLAVALQTLADHGAQRFVCLGDVCGKGGDVGRCLDLLHARDALLIRGNHDKMGAAYLVPAQRMRLEKAVRQVREGDLLFSHTTTCPDAMYGRGVWDDDRIVSLERASAQFESGGDFRVFFSGHTHRTVIYELRAGGLPLERVITEPMTVDLIPGARYLINPGPITDKSDIERENPHTKGRGLCPPSFMLFDADANRATFYFPGV